MIINDEELKNFEEDEFPEDPHEFAEPDLMISLQKTRDLLGRKIIPSLAPGALARFDHKGAFYLRKTDVSMHQVFTNKRSTAIDVFIDCSPFEAFCKLISSGIWQGVGIYFDTKNNNGIKEVMFHLDYGRKEKLLWLRDGGKYHFGAQDGFWANLFVNFLGERGWEQRKS